MSHADEAEHDEHVAESIEGHERGGSPKAYLAAATVETADVSAENEASARR
jgi:hypothetical protein